MIVTLDPNKPYTAVVGSANGSSGIAIVEVYDLEGVQAAQLANISTRGLIETGDNVMIGGFIYSGGTGATNVVIRGLGPSLRASGVNNPLSNPVLELFNSNGQKLGSNDNWADTQQAQLRASGLQPSDASESAMLLTGLGHGTYTAVLRGSGTTTGIGLLELYVYE
ncbi:MAG: hypothetical protein H0T11_00020 [Chthoniobacterales bacterium]|nr:hypothetical protein [Chthoniobacterales bacterium]